MRMPSTPYYPATLQDKLDEVNPRIIQNIHKIYNEKNGMKTSVVVKKQAALQS